MKYIKLIFIAFIYCSCAFKINAQALKPEAKKTRTAYYYTFQGAKSLEEVNQLKSPIYALKGVSEFKSEFKSDNNLAQIIVVVTEKTRVSEGDILFEITDLKHILEEKGYQPIELISETLPVE
jgi:hypothetical protein